jgi:hypothetical protein
LHGDQAKLSRRRTTIKIRIETILSHEQSNRSSIQNPMAFQRPLINTFVTKLSQMKCRVATLLATPEELVLRHSIVMPYDSFPRSQAGDMFGSKERMQLAGAQTTGREGVGSTD